MEYFTEFGYIGLFLSSFLAATILPLSSEIVLGALLMNGFSPVVLVSVATLGNVLGSLVNYAAGFFGSLFLFEKVFRLTEAEFAKAQKRFSRYGVFSLLLAWVPVIGDPLTLIAGVLKINIVVFLILVTAGKLARYLVLTLVF